MNFISGNGKFDEICSILADFSDEVQKTTSLNEGIRYIYFPYCTYEMEKGSENSNDKESLAIGISSDMTEILFKKDKLETVKFKELSGLFSEIHIEIKYTSDDFDSLYESVVQLRKLVKSKMKISVFITGIDKTDQAFFNNKLINSLIFDSCVMEIGFNNNHGSFEGCSSLMQIAIPSSVTLIGNSAFSRCSSLTQITIPSSVTSIVNNAFRGCPLLSTKMIGSNIDIKPTITNNNNDIQKSMSNIYNTKSLWKLDSNNSNNNASSWRTKTNNVPSMRSNNSYKSPNSGKNSSNRKYTWTANNNTTNKNIFSWATKSDNKSS